MLIFIKKARGCFLVESAGNSFLETKPGNDGQKRHWWKMENADVHRHAISGRVLTVVCRWKTHLLCSACDPLSDAYRKSYLAIQIECEYETQINCCLENYIFNIFRR